MPQRFGEREHEQEQDREHEQGKTPHSPLWSRNAVPRPVNIDDFAHLTRNGCRHEAYQVVTAKFGEKGRK